MSGKGNTGTMTSMTTSTVPVAGKLGQGFRFDGVNDLISTPTAILSNSVPFTVSLWIKNNSTAGTHCLFSQDSTGTDDIGFGYTVGSGISYESDTDAHSADALTAINPTTLDKNWHHLVVVEKYTTDVDENDYYFDGVKVASSLAGTAPCNPANINFVIGNRGAANLGWDGLLDDVRIYNRALSAGEIQKLYGLGQAKFANSPVTSLQSGLVGYWTFDGQHTNWATGKTFDMSGKGNHGTITNMTTSTTPVAGKLGQAFRFDGVNDYVKNSTDIIGTTALTITAWIKPSASALSIGTGRIVTNGNATIFKLASSNRLSFTSNNINTAVSATNVLSGAADKWQFVMVTRDSSGIANIYLNGSLTGTANQNSGSPTSGNDFEIGAQLGTSFFNGSLDDVRIYNRALSAGEVQRLYGLGQAKFANSPVMSLTSGLVGYWTFDGQHTNWATGKVFDMSGKGNTGTMTSMSTSTTPVAGKFGQAFKFDGVDDYVSMGTSATYGFTSSDFSASAWIYSTNLTPTGQIVGRYSNSNDGWSLYQRGSSNQIAFRTAQSGAVQQTNSNAIQTNKWYHVAAVRKGSSVSIYINGVYSVSSAGTHIDPAFNAGRNSIIGLGGTSNQYFPGLIDDVRIYNRVLSAGEVQKLYGLGR